MYDLPECNKVHGLSIYGGGSNSSDGNSVATTSASTQASSDSNSNENELPETKRKIKEHDSNYGKVAAIDINASGEWIAFGCPDRGQLMVWEWQSETCVYSPYPYFSSLLSP
jgi:hypothetical protein